MVVKTIFDSAGALEQAMTFHRERHSVLAGNVANVDTPGYRPLDLERPDPQVAAALPPGTTAAGALELARSDAHHLTAAETPASSGVLAFDDSGQSVGGDGNAVNLERELAKVDANRVRYATSSELVSRRLSLLKYAASDGGV
jgi:flagellar basal-body rod protein FlgB